MPQKQKDEIVRRFLTGYLATGQYMIESGHPLADQLPRQDVGGAGQVGHTQGEGCQVESDIGVCNR